MHRPPQSARDSGTGALEPGYNHHEFVPFPLLKNQHLMTIAPAFWPRKFTLAKQTADSRIFEVEPGSKILSHCHWQAERMNAATLVLIHGLEGSSESHYIMGITQKALSSGMNVVRMNLRNCGGSMHLTPTLYNSGMSADALEVVKQLVKHDGLKPVFLAGFSMGGNIVLKAAAELGAKATDYLSGVAAISPALDLAPCVDLLEQGFNRVYEQRFLRGLKAKIRQKKKLYPELYDTSLLDRIGSIRDFDDAYTAPLGGYGNARNYYALASALPIMDRIAIPTLIIHAQDDPFVPASSLLSPHLKNQHIHLLTPRYGGHSGFIQNQPEDRLFDHFWAENRLVKFCLSLLAAPTVTSSQNHKGTGING